MQHVSNHATPQSGAVVCDARNTCLVYSTVECRVQFSLPDVRILIWGQGVRWELSSPSDSPRLRPPRTPAPPAEAMNGSHSEPRVHHRGASPADPTWSKCSLTPHGTHSFVEEGCLEKMGNQVADERALLNLIRKDHQL